MRPPWTTVLLLLHAGWSSGLDVHFEDPTAGFFYRETRASSEYSSAHPPDYSSLRRMPSSSVAEPTTSIVLNSVSSPASGSSNASRQGGQGPPLVSDDILHSARFIVLKTAQPVLIRAEYGPFEQRQTVPTQYVVPDLSEGPAPPFNASSKPGLITDFKPHGLDLSAHTVTTEIPRDKPVLRVLFHAGGRSGSYRSLSGLPRTICIRLYVSIGNETQSTCCSPDGRDGTCLGQVTLPSRWWPSLVFNGSDEENGGGKTKHPKIIASVSYSVEEARGNSCSGNLDSRVSLIPVTQLDKIPLVQPRRGYRQLAQDEILHMLIPQTPLYPNSRLYVPVFLDQPEDDRQISVVKIRCHSRSGIKILGLEESSSEWSSRLELNPRKTIALVTVFRKKDAVTFLSEEEEPNNLTKKDHNSTAGGDYGGDSGPEELFNWLLSVDDRDFELWNAGKIAWTVEYQYADGFLGAADINDNSSNNNITTEVGGDADEDLETEESASSYPLLRTGKKLKAKLHVQKDDAQAVLAIAKHSELMNLAVLTGHQVSKPLKIFTVTEAGEIADVTLRSSCVSTDGSVLKVSASCTSVYVDGSETRGALNAQINVKYGNLMGTTVFTVWMPELPLKVDLSDTRLSQIKGWRVPYYKRDNSDRNPGKRSLRRDESVSNALSSWYVNGGQEEDRLKRASSKMTCSLRYQQSTVSIFATFLAEDLDSGRKDFYPSRGSELDITELLISNGVVRIAKSNVALLRNNVIQGLSPGKTEVHILSPISGKEIGKAEFRVAKNRESIVGMNIRILSGLKLSIHAEQSHHRRGKYSLQTAYSKVLSSKYQEGLVDVSLLFSDETLVPLSDIDDNQYHLSVKSLDPRTVAFAPLKGGKYPRIIAVGSGRGKLLRISFEPPSECSSSVHTPLSSKDAEVIIKIKVPKKKSPYQGKPRRPENAMKPFFEDHATFVAHKKSVDMGDLGDMIQDEEVSGSIFDSGRRGHHGGGGDGYFHSHRSSSAYHPRRYQDFAHLSPLEVGLYVLLAVFCATIAIFVASCFVYASRHRKVEIPLGVGPTTTRSIKSHQSVQNAHDWVWLGKSSSMDEKSVQSNASSQTPLSDLSRQRRYRQRASYMGSEVNIIPNPRTEEFELSVSDPNTPMTPHHVSQSANPPAVPPHQNIRVKKNTNPFLYDDDDLEREYLMRTQQVGEGSSKMIQPPEGGRGGELYDTVEGSFQGHSFKPDEEHVIDTSTYTKKSSSLNPESMVLPLGFPFFAQEVEDEEDDNLSSGGSSNNSWDEEEERRPPLRQSPASALPPLTEQDFIIRPEDVSRPRGEYIPLNPDIEKPSPPRKGSLIQNPMGTYIKKKANVIGNPMFPDPEVDSVSSEEHKEEEEEDFQMEGVPSEDVGMDYDQLMSYFESLKESTA